MKKRIALLVLSSMALTVAAEAQEHIFRHRIAGYTMGDRPGAVEPPGTEDPAPPEEPTENLPPVITGVPSGLTVPSGGSINLFPGITVSDPNVSQVLNAIIMLENPERGALGNLGGFMGGGDTYMMSGTAAQITAALRGMTLHPPAGGPVPGAETLNIGVLVDDPAIDNPGDPMGVDAWAYPITYTVYSPANTAPIIAGMTPGPITPAGDPISPFTTLTISDPDNDPVTVTVSVAPSQGSFTTLSGFTHLGGGVYRMAADPAAATAALRGMVFLNAEGVVPPESNALVAFTVHAEDPDGLSMSVTVEWMYFGGPPE